MSKNTVRVYEVLAEGEPSPAADGHRVFRFRNRAQAEGFAKRALCYGRPATVEAFDAPRRLAARWGLA